MDEDMKLKEVIDDLVSEKIANDENFIRITYYEAIVKKNVDKDKEQRFAELASIKLDNMGYNVYLKDEEFFYKSTHMKVQSNEILIAIKLK